MFAIGSIVSSNGIILMDFLSVYAINAAGEFLCWHHQKIAENIGMLECQFELNGPTWKTRILEYQRKAMNNKPAYVKRRPGPIKYIPTDEGKQLLPTDLREKIIEMLEEDIAMENNMLLLELGLSNLLEVAQVNQVELDTLLGIIASFADGVRLVILCNEED